ncbi:MAG TPA: hypothetical protein VJ598_08480 [Albitalea sp.]|nr:hypothetical protein [Albitalea sp.]
MSSTWRTAWQGQDIVIFREDDEIDRVNASQIQRVVFVYGGGGESASDLLYAVVETRDDLLLFPADTGFAGRINFERSDYWADRGCVYWVHQSRAPLPLRLRRGRWWLHMSGPTYKRMPRAEFANLMDRWPLEGPETWEQRKWRRIERSRPFAPAAPDDSHHRVRT